MGPLWGIGYGVRLTLAGTRTYAQFGLYLTAALLWRMRWLE